MTLDPFMLLRDAQTALDQKLRSFGEVEPAVGQVFGLLQTATQHMQAGRLAEAAAAFDHVAEVAVTAKQTEIQAQARYSQGGMLAALPDKQTEAIAAFQQAAMLSAECDNSELQQQAEQQIQQIRQQLEISTVEVSDLDAAIAAFTDQTSPQQKVELYGRRGRCYAKAGQFQQAMPDFEAAFAIARQSADVELIGMALNQLQCTEAEGGQGIFSTALDSLSQQVKTSGNEDLQRLISSLRPQLERLLHLPAKLLNSLDINALLSLDGSLEAAYVLQANLASELEQLETEPLFKLLATFQVFQAIEMALAQEQFSCALEQANAERRKALQASDHQRYLRFALACILMSRAYEGLGDRPAVIEVLLYGKATLEHAKSKAAGQPFLELLNTLENRWGKDGLLQARLVYREHMQRYGKYRLNI